ncbi:hypothetical protein [Solitalea canadensis]|uniref:DUF4386 domain-containing protein n=1 Tax=Solitalea canadensis (strain ATCC 29591 / DSM 3403 / JCM 21819 / LMG 8368 / NBRC 15130 / NCIMB 12057 / USAM 9D) TaxID=929556 RepID=H8KXK9_SOLCM|nr:hypothetical protein [Solitalea canadensis]AFD05305.1 hypothetical protein Solca_0151 [Solitalea canadensis DSM 3403]
MNKRVITGLTIIGGAGLLFAFGDLLIPQENVIFDAVNRPKEFAALVTSGPYQWWAARGFVGVLMEMIGTITLYQILAKTKAEKWAFAGLLLSLTHQILGCGVFAVIQFLFPVIGQEVLNGNTEIIKYASINGGLAILFGISLISTLSGLALMAVAIFKSGVLPKWSGWIVFLGFALIPFPGVALQFIANTLWGGAYFWMAIHIYRRYRNDLFLESLPVRQ